MEQANSVQELILWTAFGFLGVAITIVLILGKEIKKEMQKPDSDIRKGFNDSSIHDSW